MVVENTQAARDVGRCNRGTIAEREHSIDVLTSHRLQDRIGCCLRRFEMRGNRTIAPRVIQLVAAIRHKDKFNAQLASGLVEATRLVAEFRSEDKESQHLLPT